SQNPAAQTETRNQLRPFRGQKGQGSRVRGLSPIEGLRLWTCSSQPLPHNLQLSPVGGVIPEFWSVIPDESIQLSRFVILLSRFEETKRKVLSPNEA
ncbi:MAG: hypothetical protein ACK53Y_27445, partial [bacterium]